MMIDKKMASEFAFAVRDFLQEHPEQAEGLKLLASVRPMSEAQQRLFEIDPPVADATYFNVAVIKNNEVIAGASGNSVQQSISLLFKNAASGVYESDTSHDYKDIGAATTKLYRALKQNLSR